MRRLVLVWAVWRLTRRVAAIGLIAGLGVLLLSGGTAHRSRGALTHLERTARPLVRDLGRTLKKDAKP
jgi:hypothetical protein